MSCLRPTEDALLRCSLTGADEDAVQLAVDSSGELRSQPRQEQSTPRAWKHSMPEASQDEFHI